MAQSVATDSPSPFCLDLDPSGIVISREISCSPSSTIYEIQLAGNTCVMKLFHDNGDPGYTPKGRDLNRFRCELNAYHNLRTFGMCDTGCVPAFHGYIDRIDPIAFDPPLKRFVGDKFQPRAILLEYLPDAEKLNCVNYSDELIHEAIHGIQEIHRALVHHQDIYPKNVFIVSCSRAVWIDFDVATTFPSMGTNERAYCEYETELVKGFGELLSEDQAQGLPPNTKYY
ncbi:unnamed protein product [Penicillium bialowiezense]